MHAVINDWLVKSPLQYGEDLTARFISPLPVSTFSPSILIIDHISSYTASDYGIPRSFWSAF